MKKFLKNFLMIRLIDIVINKSLREIVIFLNSINLILYLKIPNCISMTNLGSKNINKY